MPNLIALLVSLIISFSGQPMPFNGHIDLCNGISVDNVDRFAVSEITDLWFVRMNDDSMILIFDSCSADYHAYAVSDFSRIEF